MRLGSQSVEERSSGSRLNFPRDTLQLLRRHDSLSRPSAVFRSAILGSEPFCPPADLLVRRGQRRGRARSLELRAGPPGASTERTKGPGPSRDPHTSLKQTGSGVAEVPVKQDAERMDTQPTSKAVLVEFNHTEQPQNSPTQRHKVSPNQDAPAPTEKRRDAPQPESCPSPRHAPLWMEAAHLPGASLHREPEERRSAFSGRERDRGPLCAVSCTGNTNLAALAQDRQKGNVPSRDKSKCFSIESILSKSEGEMRSSILGLAAEACAERPAFSPSVFLGSRQHQLYQMGFPLCSYLSLTYPDKVLHFK
ncbi:forkhead box protein L1 [Scomber scombrus]|uniref:Forkhead box protein L1 n=1 Tax=Scomber scombrus TaxID=13677 RepID=A0AAV1P7R5_SCOSC